MHTFKLLLAHSDRRISNIIESLLRTICRERAVLDCTRTERIDAFTEAASQDHFDLVIVAPSCLLPVSRNSIARLSVSEAISAIRTVKALGPFPIIALGVVPKDEMVVSRAGVDFVLGEFNCHELTSAVERLSLLPSPQTNRESATAVLWKSIASRISHAWRQVKPGIGSNPGTAI